MSTPELLSLLAKRDTDYETAADSLKEEEKWVTIYKLATPKSELQLLLVSIRTALATVRLEFVQNIGDFAKTHDLQEDLSCFLALHHRHPDFANILYLLPPLVEIENLRDKSLDVEEGALPGHGLKVLIVTTAKTVIHEFRRFIGTMLFGTKAEQGEAGEFFEVFRYGAKGEVSLPLPSPTPPWVRFTGYPEGSPFLHQLMPATVHYLAELARTGKFIGVKRFFVPHAIVPVLKSCIPLHEFKEAVLPVGCCFTGTPNLKRETPALP
ncbi:hypothetical protein B0H19DRAFT_1326557 [Mycena capillaripes]|nr:hypothetical protein B0H19DRAFT_1326557 [Mycena capillaripes]